MGRAKRIWYLSPMRAAKVQASLRIRAVSPEPPLLAHTSSESRGTFRQKARSLAPLNGWACAVKICHDGMLEDTNSLVAAHVIHTFPDDLIPLIKQRKTTVQAPRRHRTSCHLRYPCCSMPPVSSRTLRLQYVQYSKNPNISDTRKFAAITLKIEQDFFSLE